MRIAIVGPTHPYKGGIAQHTTLLATAVADLGHNVLLESWKRQYPAALYKGQLTVDEDKPEVPVYGRTLRRLSWNRPDSWVAAARRMQNADAVIFAVANPVQLAPYLVMLPFLRKAGVRTIAIMHNVLPHESHPWDKALTVRFLRAIDKVIVHSKEQEDLAASLAGTPVVSMPLPPMLGASDDVPALPERHDAEAELRLLFFGLVRPYKGLDVLLKALPEVPQARVTVAGEFWAPRAETDALTDELGVSDRVEIHDGYVETAEIPAYFEQADLIVLPYRTVTGSGIIGTARSYHRPVIVSDVGALPDEAGRSGGLVFRSEDPADLARVLREACDPATFNALAAHAASYSDRTDDEWEHYATAVVD